MQQRHLYICTVSNLLVFVLAFVWCQSQYFAWRSVFISHQWSISIYYLSECSFPRHDITAGLIGGSHLALSSDCQIAWHGYTVSFTTSFACCIVRDIVCCILSHLRNISHNIVGMIFSSKNDDHDDDDDYDGSRHDADMILRLAFECCRCGKILRDGTYLLVIRRECAKLRD